MPDAAYLDYNATAPLRPEARDAMQAGLARTGNPSSVHVYGREARRDLEAARDAVAMLVGAHPQEVVFTGSGTEANNLALRGPERRRVLVSAVEHDSVLAAHPAAERIPVDRQGRVEPTVLDAMLSESEAPTLVSIMLANNETGVVQPVAQAAEIAHEHGALVHCDAVQGPAKIAVDFVALDVDFLTLSAHKIGGPQGMGALVVRDGLDLEPLIRGGGQERRRRAGTENVIGAIGFGAAAMAVRASDEARRVGALRDRLEREATAAVPDSVIIGDDAERLPNTTCLAFPGQPSETQVMALDLAGVAVSAGSACSSGKVAASHVLGAMGVDKALANSAIRVSLGWASSERDVERFVEAWAAIAERAGQRAVVN